LEYKHSIMYILYIYKHISNVYSCDIFIVTFFCEKQRSGAEPISQVSGTDKICHYIFYIMSRGVPSSRIHLNDLGTTQAKVIVLGDSGTGKSELIRNLDPAHSESDVEDIRNDNFFRVVEIPPEELENTSSPVVLKFWEHSAGISKQEEELAFRGALFCFVTFDIRNPDSANAALNKWVSLKEAHAPECFLFIIGTYLDEALHRRVDLKDICKASAKKDAIYLEISNSTRANVGLFRKLIKQRLNYMLYRKEVVSAQRTFESPTRGSSAGIGAAAEAAGGGTGTGDDVSGNSSHRRSGDHDTSGGGSSSSNHNNNGSHAEHKEEHGQGHGHGTTTSAEPHDTHGGSAAAAAAGAGQGVGSSAPMFQLRRSSAGDQSHASGSSGGHGHSHSHGPQHSLVVPALEPNVLCDSVGSILASHLGTEYWPGLEEEGDELERIGWKLGTFIEQLSTTGADISEAGLATASAALLDDSLTGQHNFKGTPKSGIIARSTGLLAEGEYVDSDYTVSDLKSAFEILGLTLPSSLDASLIAQDNNSSHIASSSGLERARKSSVSNKGKSTPTSATPYLRKMAVKLPDGTSADMILDLDSNIEQQIELFLLSNSLANDDEARQKLIGIGRQVQHRYNAKEGKPAAQPQPYRSNSMHHSYHNHSTAGSSGSGGGSGNNSLPTDNNMFYSLPPPPHLHSAASSGSGATGKKFKLRINLGASGLTDIVVRSGENIDLLVQNLAGKYQLSREQEQRVYDQLVSVLGH
jgi:hypothetical protein